MDKGVVGGDEKEEAETERIDDIPELEEPGSGSLSVDDEADEPGDDDRREFVEVSGASAHVPVNVRVQDIEVIGRIKDGGGQETKEEV
jgi:hypothetical protein